MNTQKYISHKTPNFFRIGAFSCPHHNADLYQGEDNLIRYFTHLENTGLDFDFITCNGDWDSNQVPPTIANNSTEGLQIITSLDDISRIGLTHSHVYSLSGNHDGGEGEMEWYLEYIDPLGENTSVSKIDNNLRPYPITFMEAGSWHSYYITFGKNLMMFISDRNELIYPYGRDSSPEVGGHPSGTITLQTWNWMKSVILNNKDKNIFIKTHQNPRFTTIGTGDGDGRIGYSTGMQLHGFSGIPLLSGSLGSIYDEDTLTAESPTSAFLDFLRDNPSHTVVNWDAGHSHGYQNETVNGRGERYTIHGVNFQNVQHLTRFHTSAARSPTQSMSKVYEISDYDFKVRHYNHESIGGEPIGFNNALEYTIPLKV